MAVTTSAPLIDQQAGRRLRAWLDAQRPPRPAQIARQAGVSRQFVSNVLAGRAKPTLGIVKACDELGLPIEAIFGAAVTSELLHQTPDMREPDLSRAQDSRDTTDAEPYHSSLRTAT